MSEPLELNSQPGGWSPARIRLVRRIAFYSLVVPLLLQWL
jgi:hypothetical protein